MDNAELRALEGHWVELSVGAFDYQVRAVTREQADAWWQAHRPTRVAVPALDLSVTDIRSTADILDLDSMTLDQAMDAAIPAFGSKASHYAAFAEMDRDRVPHLDALAIPIAHYVQHLAHSGLDQAVAELLDNPEVHGDPVVRMRELATLRQAIMGAPLDPALEEQLVARLRAEYPGTRMRFRSSSNAEDLDGFTGAGLYTSRSGDPIDDPYAYLPNMQWGAGIGGWSETTLFIPDGFRKNVYAVDVAVPSKPRVFP